MSLRKSWFCVLVFSIAVISQISLAQLQVRDASARVDSKDSRLRLTLPLVNHPTAAKVSVSLKLLDPENKVRASSVTEVTLHAGQREIEAYIEKPLADLR